MNNFLILTFLVGFSGQISASEKSGLALPACEIKLSEQPKEFSYAVFADNQQITIGFIPSLAKFQMSKFIELGLCAEKQNFNFCEIRKTLEGIAIFSENKQVSKAWVELDKARAFLKQLKDIEFCR